MSEELVALLKRTLRMPWEAHLRPGRWDDVVLNRYPGEGSYTKEFLKVPKNEEARVLAIALPTLMFLIHKPAVNTEDLTQWEDLTREEQQMIVRYYGLRNSQRIVFIPILDALDIKILASYIAGCFTFTATSPAMLCQFGEIVDSALEYERGQQSMYLEMRNSPLLIVSGMLGKHPNMKKVEGAIVDLLAWRIDRGYPTVTLELPTSARMMDAVMNGALLTKEMYLGLLDSSDLGMNRVGALLASASTYVYVGSDSRALNDSRISATKPNADSK